MGSKGCVQLEGNSGLCIETHAILGEVCTNGGGALRHKGSCSECSFGGLAAPVHPSVCQGTGVGGRAEAAGRSVSREAEAVEEGCLNKIGVC